MDKITTPSNQPAIDLDKSWKNNFRPVEVPPDEIWWDDVYQKWIKKYAFDVKHTRYMHFFIKKYTRSRNPKKQISILLQQHQVEYIKQQKPTIVGYLEGCLKEYFSDDPSTRTRPTVARSKKTDRG